jgi:beta-phosphoglucomutase
MIEGIVFDLDDLLVFTEPVHCDAYIETLGRYGIELTREEFYNHWTKQGKRLKDFVEMHGLDLDYKMLGLEKRKVYKDMLADGMKTADNAKETLEALKEAYPLALATSSYRDNVDFIMDLTGFGKYFGVIVSRDESKKSKPDPACFLMATDGLGKNPEQCLAVDDSWKGISAAQTIDMKTVWIPTEITKYENIKADLKLKKLKELTPEIVRSLG